MPAIRLVMLDGLLPRWTSQAGECEGEFEFFQQAWLGRCDVTSLHDARRGIKQRELAQRPGLLL